MVATRKTAHGQLVNEILKQGVLIKTEKLSYKGFQKNFGKSVGKRAPGLFMETLRDKAGRAGGVVMEFEPRTTALSQVCQCGARKKKALSERWHDCTVCGIKAQRDLYSAFLSRFVSVGTKEGDRLERSQAQKAWASGGGILLGQAISNLEKTARSRSYPASFGLKVKLPSGDRAVGLCKGNHEGMRL